MTNNTFSPINHYKYPESDYNKPWGWWETTGVSTMPSYHGGYAHCDKQISIHAGVSLSVQKHFWREEYWQITKGRVVVFIGDTLDTMKEYHLSAGQKIHIPVGSWHFIKNIGKDKAIFLERQVGVLLDERDIVRAGDSRGFDEQAIKSHEILVKETGLHAFWPPTYAHKIFPTDAPDHFFPPQSENNSTTR
ncbi:MAG: hypothetical protein EOM37_06865 [Proteobacteria bacterium]|nr:hypothetical protein [Pseudomonadota bacterium]